MKYLLIALLALTACSKSKVDPPVSPVELRATIISSRVIDDTHRGIDIHFNTNVAVTSSGNIVIEWDEYNSATKITHHSRGASVVFSNSTAFVFQTDIVVDKGNTAKNTKIVSVSMNGGVVFEY